MVKLSMAQVATAAALLLPTSVLAQSPDEEPYFMGWYLAPDSTEAINCLTNEVHTTVSGDRNYAACCKSGADDCRVATDCYGTTVVYNDNSTMECTSGNYCMSFSILQSFPDGQPSAVQLWCNTFWRAHTIYKELPTAAIQTRASTVTLTTTAIPEATVTHTSPVETAAPGASQNGHDDNGSAGASNKAWVAGAVIGPIAALGLVGLAFWYGRRRAMESRETAVAGAGAGAVAGGRGSGPQHSHAPMGSVTNSSNPIPLGYAPFVPGQHPPPPSTVTPYYYFQGNPGANQHAPPAPQQNPYASYWAKESPHSNQSTPISAEATLAQGQVMQGSSTYPPAPPGNPIAGYYA